METSFHERNKRWMDFYKAAVALLSEYWVLSLVLVLFLIVCIENGGLEILTQLRTIMSKCLISAKFGGVIKGKMCDLSNNKLFFYLKHLYQTRQLKTCFLKLYPQGLKDLSLYGNLSWVHKAWFNKEKKRNRQLRHMQGECLLFFFI